ncbi:bud site selection protein 31 [Nematocida homosporus]|uniref:bud site selection protein 31 n=1 Tax=Nematocida homosporus TaxID=1912981 RepID=UPI00221E8174|nr:bud site selection protein 31 [Nematocida homosporus]KAI5187439.1 bud site selection protein 31 [Nematocida homosporus]
MDEALYNKTSGRREIRQARILQISRERTREAFLRWKQSLISKQDLAQLVREGKVDGNLIRAWKKGMNLCCVLCIRKGKRCVCRKVKGIICTNCLCSGECI